MEDKKINSFQFMALAFVCTISPMIHTLPDGAAFFAGDRAWLSCVVGLIPETFLCFVMAAVIARTGNCDMCSVLCRSWGSFFGKILCAAFCGWMVFLAGFILRAEGQRFVSTAYPLADPRIFAAVSLLLCVPAVLGSTDAVARLAMLLRPMLALVLIVLFASALPGVNLRGLWQPTANETGKICLGSLTAAEPLCFALYPLFFAHRLSSRPRAPQYAGLLAAVFSAAFLLTVTVLGTFGTELSRKLYAPFFSMVRDIDLFGDVDRVEAVVTAVWVFSDFVLTAVLLQAGSRCLMNVFPLKSTVSSLLCCAGAFWVGIRLGPTSRALDLFIKQVVPLGNLVALVLILLTLAIGKLRKTDFG